MRTQVHGVSGAIIALVAGLVAGCGPPQPFEPGFYQVPRTTLVSPPPQPVAVYRFTDERWVDDPAHIARYVSSGRISRYRATEPVAVGVTRAFVEGLKARGIPVVALPVPFNAGGSQLASWVAITGTVLEFESVVDRTGIFTHGQRVACRVVLQVYDSTTGKKLWEKSYSRNGDDVWFRGARFFAKALAEIVEEAVNDAGLVALLGAKQH
ncbi:MAG: hypothetical protein HY665_08615 [Chloroflexi bacterium]|nr:hypothetical protein [Chloroflexota bacterium]